MEKNCALGLLGSRRFGRRLGGALAALAAVLLALALVPSVALAEGTLYSHWDATNGSLSFYTAEAPASSDDASVASLKAAIDPYRSNVTSIDFSKAGSIALSGNETAGLFDDCQNLKDIVSLGNLDTSAATDMSCMFQNCYCLESIDTSGLETQNVTDIAAMFRECRALKSIDLSSWDLSNVTAMRSLFVNCTSLTSAKLPKIGNPRLNDMGHLFWGCTSLREGDISTINTRTVVKSSWAGMSGIFGGYYSGWGETFESYDADLYKIVTGPDFVQNPGVYKSGFPKTMYRIDDGSHEKFASQKVIPDGAAVYVVRAALTLDGNGATSGSMDDTLLYYYSEGATPLPANVYKREGYTFLGWSPDPNAMSATVTDGESLNFDAVTEKAQRVKGDAQGEEFAYTLYAVWAKNPTITFDPNGGTGTMDPITFGYGATSALPACTFARSNYHFIGWNTAADGSGTAYADGAELSLKADVTLYAQWAANPVITFDANGGTGTMYPITVVPGVATELPACGFSCRAHDFAGWNTAKDGTGTAYADASQISTTSSLTLYAQWSEQTYTLTYDPNGGTWADGTTGAVSMTYGKASEPATILDAPTREGYRFVRWEGSSYQPGDAYDTRGDDGLLTDDTLTAVWEKASSPAQPGSATDGGKAQPKADRTDAASQAAMPDTGDMNVMAAPVAAAGFVALAAAAFMRHRIRG